MVVDDDDPQIGRLQSRVVALSGVLSNGNSPPNDGVLSNIATSSPMDRDQNFRSPGLLTACTLVALHLRRRIVRPAEGQPCKTSWAHPLTTQPGSGKGDRHSRRNGSRSKEQTTMSTITSWTRDHRLPVFFALTFRHLVVVVAVLRDGHRSHPVFRLRTADRRADRHRHDRRSLRLPRAGFADDPLAGRLDLVDRRDRPAAGRAGRRAAANVGIWDASVPVDLAWAGIALNFAVRFVDPLDGPLGEEPGWRGYAVPQLQRRRTPLASAVLLGVAVAAWHLPLVVAGRLDAIGLVDHLRDHSCLFLAVQPHRRQRAADHGLPRGPGDVQPWRPSGSSVRTPPGWTG